LIANILKYLTNDSEDSRIVVHQKYFVAAHYSVSWMGFGLDEMISVAANYVKKKQNIYIYLHHFTPFYTLNRKMDPPASKNA